MTSLTREDASRLCGGPIAMDDLTPDDMVPVGDIAMYPNNPRRGDVEAIVESLAHNGLFRRLVVQRATPDGDARMRILAGNHTYEAATRVGYTRLPVEYVTCTDVEARRIVLVDNRASDFASYDETALASLLHGLRDDLHGTGYRDTDLTDLMARLSEGGLFDMESALPDDTSPIDFRKEKTGATAELHMEHEEFTHTCPRCQFEWDDK